MPRRVEIAKHLEVCANRIFVGELEDTVTQFAISGWINSGNY
jgi:hypothetical protein